jgi:ribosomal protein S6
VLLRLRGNPAILPELERHYRLTEGIIKSLVIRLNAEPKEEPVMVAQSVSGEEEESSLPEDEEDEEGR